MTGTCLERFIRKGPLAAMVVSAMLMTGSTTSVQAWHDGYAHGSGGVLPGAIIGGAAGAAIGGKKGILPGAIIGGVVGGAAANAARRPPPPPPPRYYQPGPPPPAYNNGLVYNIQTSLTRLGYDPGPVDGVYGQRTADAISAFEYNKQLPVTGQPSPGLLQILQQEGG